MGRTVDSEHENDDGDEDDLLLHDLEGEVAHRALRVARHSLRVLRLRPPRVSGARPPPPRRRRTVAAALASCSRCSRMRSRVAWPTRGAPRSVDRLQAAAAKRTHPSPPSLRWWPTSCRASAPPRPWASSRPSRRSRSSPGTPGCGSTHLVAPPVVVDDAIDFPAISFPGYDDMMHRTKGAARRAWPRRPRPRPDGVAVQPALGWLLGVCSAGPTSAVPSLDSAADSISGAHP